MLKKIIDSKYLFYIFAFFMFLTVMSKIGLQLYNPDMTYADDYYYSRSRSLHDMYNYLLSFYLGQDGLSGSRLLIYFLTLTVASANIWIWRILNSLFILLLIYSIARFNYNKNNSYPFVNNWIVPIVILFSISLMNISAVYWSIFWVTGSFNYLWSPVAVVLCLYPFFQLFDNKGCFATGAKSSYFYIFPLLLAASSEQGSAVVFLFSLIAILFHYLSIKKISIPAIVLSLISLANIIVHLLSPGNSARIVTETLRWFPEYANMTLFDRLFDGYHWTILYHFFGKSHNLLFILLLTIVIILYQTHAKRNLKVMAVFSLAYISLYIILSTINMDLPNMLGIYNNKAIDVVAPNGFTVIMMESFKLIPAVIQTAILFMIPHVMFRIFKVQIALPIVLMYFASLASSLIMSFSPTLYASGYRTFFLSDLLFVILIVYMFTYMLDVIKLNKKVLGYYFLISVVLFLFNIKVVMEKYIERLLGLLF